MSESLFDIVGEYRELYAMLTDVDADTEQVIKDSLEGVEGALQVKASGYVSIINQLEMEKDACKKHKDEWDRKLKTRENAIKMLKKRMQDAMVALDMDSIKTDDIEIKLVNNGGALPVVIDGDVPESLTKITIENDMKKIAEYLKKNPDCKFAHFGERGKRLSIK